MSKIALTPNASGTGTLTIAAPNTSTDRTITLPDETGSIITTGSSGQVIPAAALPAGSVLQVVQATQSTNVTTTGTTLIDTGLSVNITPSSSSSKVLIQLHQHIYINSDNGFGWQLLRDSTELYYFWNVIHTQSAGNNYQFHPFVYLDSPATTSQITYKTKFQSRDSGELAGVSDGSRANNCVIIAMEIAG